MSHLNWEADSRRRMPRDFTPDMLPDTGSWADRQRYGVFPTGRRIRAAERAPGAVITRSRPLDFEQLELYAKHAMQPEFRRKPEVMRREVLGNLSKLRARCVAWGYPASLSEGAALALAERALARHT